MLLSNGAMKRKRNECDDELRSFLVRPFSLGKWEAVLKLEKHLRLIFRSSLLCASDMLVWQAAFKICYHLCLTHQEYDVFEVIMLVLREEGERADLVSQLPNSDRSWGHYVFPQLRSAYMFVCLILCRLRISRNLWLNIFLFSVGSCMDKKKACTAVLNCCSYLGRFWILNNRGNRGVSWGMPLFKLVFPQIFLC
jgi:hypothetical protein